MPPLAARGGATTLLWSRSAPPKIRPTRRAAEIWLCLARCIGTGAQHGAALMLGQQRTQYDTERPRLVSGGTLAARQSERARARAPLSEQCLSGGRRTGHGGEQHHHGAHRRRDWKPCTSSGAPRVHPLLVPLFRPSQHLSFKFPMVAAVTSFNVAVSRINNSKLLPGKSPQLTYSSLFPYKHLKESPLDLEIV